MKLIFLSLGIFLFMSSSFALAENCVGAAKNVVFLVQAESGEKIEGLLKKRGSDNSLGLKSVRTMSGLPQDQMFADFVVARKNLYEGWKFDFIRTFADGSRMWSDLQKDRRMRDLQRGRRCDDVMVYSYN